MTAHGAEFTGTRNRRPEFHQLEVFLTVVETKSFTTAAHLLGRTQPAISQAIARLEEIYGADLFERRRSAPLALTPVAKAILPTARQILHAIDQQKERAIATAQSRTGRLSLGLSASFASGPLRDGLADFIAENPDIRLSVVEGHPSKLCQQLSDRNLDVLITARTSDLPASQFSQETLWEDELFIALPATHPLAGQPQLSRDQISRLRLHLRARASETGLYRSLLAPSMSPLDCGEHDVSNEVLLDMASIGMGVTIVPRSARIERTDLVYRPISDLHDRITFQAIWPREDRNPLRHRFINHIKKGTASATVHDPSRRAR